MSLQACEKLLYAFEWDVHKSTDQIVSSKDSEKDSVFSFFNRAGRSVWFKRQQGKASAYLLKIKWHLAAEEPDFPQELVKTK